MGDGPGQVRPYRLAYRGTLTTLLTVSVSARLLRQPLPLPLSILSRRAKSVPKSRSCLNVVFVSAACARLSPSAQTRVAQHSVDQARNENGAKGSLQDDQS